MKKFILAALIGVASLTSISAQAQLSVNINIGSQPQWGPEGYNYVEYYYLPELDVYYNVPSQQYVYQKNNKWVWAKRLPSKYKNYDLYNSYKVVMNQKQPYLTHNTHVNQYSQYKNQKGRQVNIRDTKDNRYNNARNNSIKYVQQPVKQKTVVRVNPAQGRAQVNQNNKQNNNNSKDKRQSNNSNNGNRQPRGNRG
ncbi:hypothetical protein [Pedobacter sp.]|uniref:hypothetical protein n=1 Tax=Pedobacter sp. TaxID=1411316 RepID=UPI003D7F904C